jgi:hypothetical protein
MAYCDQCGSPLDAGGDEAAAAAPQVPTSASPAAPASPPAAQVASPASAPQAAALSEQSQAAPAATATSGPMTVTAPDASTPSAAPAGAAGPLIFKFPSGLQFVASSDVTNIGRADAAQDWHPELDVIPYGGGVPEMGVSRHHARLVHQDDKYLLMDVGSTNGTYVNGTALEYNKAAELKDGDTVAFGAFSMQVILH